MNTGEKRALTLYLFLHFVKDEVEELVVTLEHARHFFFFLARLVGAWGDYGGTDRHTPSRPPVNLTRMRASTYLARSRIASRLGLSSVGWGPWGPPWRPPPCPRGAEKPPPRAPRIPPPRPC